MHWINDNWYLLWLALGFVGLMSSFTWEPMKKFPVLSLFFSPPAFCLAVYLMFVWKFSHGEGAAGGVVIVWFAAKVIAVLAFLFGFAAILVDFILHKAKAIASSLVALLILALFWNSVQPPSKDPQVPPTEPLLSERRAGELSAIDEGIFREEECNRGSSDFVDGCKNAVRQRTSQNR